MKILDNLVAQSILLALILTVPMLFASGLPGSENHSFKFNQVAAPKTTKATEAATTANADSVTVNETEQQEIQFLKDSSTPTCLNKITTDHPSSEHPN